MDIRKSSVSDTAVDEAIPATGDTSDQALLTLLKRLKATSDPTEVRQLSDQVERLIFHKQFRNE